jgi:hypothetical protein
MAVKVIVTSDLKDNNTSERNKKPLIACYGFAGKHGIDFGIKGVPFDQRGDATYVWELVHTTRELFLL